MAKAAKANRLWKQNDPNMPEEYRQFLIKLLKFGHVENNGNPPKVRWLSQKELALGSLPTGSVEIGPITPDFSGGGTALSNFDGSALAEGETLHIEITGPRHPTGALYSVAEIRADRALHWTIVAAPVSAS